MPISSRIHRLVLPLLVLVLLTPAATATWSILIVDTATGEVAVGIATCLAFFDLRPNTVVVIPGVGVAAAQSWVGPLSLRQLIREQLLAGTAPAQILALLSSTDPSHQTRQYGIADTQGRTTTFTGSGAAAWAGSLTGQIGTLSYTIQGNILTGSPVVQNAEAALITTQGTMAEKLMAAMQAARAMGGDGRCSCSPSSPTACGSPPPNFTKSSHIALMIVSRPGDPDAPCNGSLGCGAGTYYLDLNVANQPATAPDPVLQLQSMFNAWQSLQTGRPDHFQSTVSLATPTIPANGVATSTATVTLRDAQGATPTTNPTVSASLNTSSSATGVQVGPVVALGNGNYTFSLTSGIVPGECVIDVVADDGLGTPITLSPSPSLTVGNPFGNCGRGTVDDGQGGFMDVLRIGNSPGVDRIASVGFNQSFTLQMDAPPSAGGLTGEFMLWARLGIPSLGENWSPGPTIGTMCFPPFPLLGAPPTVLLADSIGGQGFLPAGTAPWTTVIPGISNAGDLSVQGLVVESSSNEIGVTNAILLRVAILPPPQVTQVAPSSPAPGATVTVDGTGFITGAMVNLSGVLVTPSSITPNQITFPMPTGAICNSLLWVVNGDGQSSNTLGFNPTPVITTTLFQTGPAAGGAPFYVFGANLQTATVTIGGVPATISSQTNASIAMTTPPGTAGPASVVISTSTGCSATTTYTYL